MTVSQTSRQAYAEIADKLGERQEQVYNAIKYMGRASNEQIARYLDVPINYVTPRTNELGKYNLIAVDGVTKNLSGASAKVWVVLGLEDRKLRMISKEEDGSY